MVSSRTGQPRHVVVVGGGIAGLAAARRLTVDGPPGLLVTVLDAAPVLGGKLRTSAVAGLPVDEAAEMFLARVPEAVRLAAEVGLGEELVHPATTQAAVWSRGRLRPLPAGTLLGVPADLRALAGSGLLSAAGVARAAADLVLPRTPLDGDVSVGAYVGARFGREVVDRLVDPLLGGVYAGRADALSFAATLPQLIGPAARWRSLLLAARRTRHASPPRTDPVFATVPGGLGRLADAVATAVSRAPGARLRTGVTVRELGRTGRGWRLVAGSAWDPEVLDADAVVLATPARPAGRLLAGVAPGPAAELAGIDYASVALVTLAFRRTGMPALPGSGFLVPAVEGRLTKAVTFVSAKWAHLDVDPDLLLLRASVGRHGDVADLQRDDADLVAGVRADLREMLGVDTAPVATRVSRWGGALPQYAVGHVERVRRIRAGLPRSVAVCGAAYDGLGVPACIRTADAAVDRVLGALR